MRREDEGKWEGIWRLGGVWIEVRLCEGWCELFAWFFLAVCTHIIITSQSNSTINYKNILFTQSLFVLPTLITFVFTSFTQTTSSSPSIASIT